MARGTIRTPRTQPRKTSSPPRSTRGVGHVARHQHRGWGEFRASPPRPIPADSVRLAADRQDVLVQG